MKGPHRLAYGTMALVGLYDPDADLSEARDALALALDAGVRCLHSAWHYGDGRAFDLAREATARAPGPYRHVVKVDGHPGRLLDGDEGVYRALDRLGVERVDVQLVESREGFADHTTLDDVYADVAARGPAWEALQRAVAEGVVGRVGIEAYDHDHVRRAAALDGLDFVVADMSAMRMVVPPDRVPERIARGDLELVAIRPLAGGWLTDGYRTLDDFPPRDFRREWYHPGAAYRGPLVKTFERSGIGVVDGALRFLAALPYVATIVVGMRTRAHVAAALRALGQPPLPPALVAEVAGLFDQPVVLEPD